MRRTLSLLLLSAASLAPAATSQECPIQGITTTSFGAGTPLFGPNQLTLTWDATNCALSTQIDNSACCNVFLVYHYLAISPSQLAVPQLLGRPFLPGSTLYVGASFVSTALNRSADSLPVPPDPALVGSTFVVQAFSIFFSTRPYPGGVSLGSTQGLVVTFF